MKKPLKKTQAIRDILTAAGRPMKLDELQPRLERKLKQIVGKQKLYTLLSVMQNDGELESVGRAENRFYLIKQRKAAA